MKILIVEDSFITRQLLKNTLSPLGECDVAVNGEEAVLAFRMAFESQQPYNFICMDVLMPVMDGNQALKMIRAIEQASRVSVAHEVKIVMITACDDPTSCIDPQYLDRRSTSFLVKPFNGEDLIKEIINLGLYREHARESGLNP